MFGYGIGLAFRKGTVLAFLLASLASAATGGTITITALGDSLVHGFGLKHREGFVWQLNEWLTRREVDATVTNAGVSGDTTAGGLERIEWTLDSNPDALIVVLGGNDLLRGISPAESRSNLDGILAAAEDAEIPVLLVGLEVPSNFGTEYKIELENAFRELAEKYDALFHESFFEALTREGSRDEVRIRYMQSDGIHPNADGISLIVEDIGITVLELVQRVVDRGQL